MVSNSLVTLRARKLVMQVFAEKKRELVMQFCRGRLLVFVA